MSRATANLLLLSMGAIWGLGFAAQQTAMYDIGPILFVGLRFLLAAIAVVPLALRELSQRRTLLQLDEQDDIGTALSRGAVGRFCVLGVVFFLALSVQQVGLLGTTITNAGFLTGLYVLVVPILSSVVFGQSPSKVVWLSAMSSLTGVFLLSSGDLRQLTWGDLLVIGGSLLWATHVILVTRFGQATGLPFTMACWQFAVSGLLGLVGHSFLFGVGWADAFIDVAAIGRATPEILYAGLISGALAFTIQAVAQRHTSPSVAVVLMSTESLFAALAGAVLLQEQLPVAGYFGGLLILTSVILVQVASTHDSKAMASQQN